MQTAEMGTTGISKTRRVLTQTTSTGTSTGHMHCSITVKSQPMPLNPRPYHPAVLHARIPALTRITGNRDRLTLSGNQRVPPGPAIARSHASHLPQTPRLCPRNKFADPGSQRKAILVKNHKIYRTGNTILFTEFRNTANWRSLSDPVADNENLIKSHRPITPFRGRSAGANVFDEPANYDIARFEYPDLEELTEVMQSLTNNDTGLIVGNGGSGSSLEAVNDVFKGKANFAFLDGHVELEEMINTVINRQWGDRFYSISGNNKLIDPVEPQSP